MVNIIDGNNALYLEVLDKDTFSRDEVIGTGALRLDEVFSQSEPKDV